MADNTLDFVLDERSSLPIYQQLVRAIRHRIESGTYKPGDQLPSEREISEHLGISRMTVRQAMRNLSSAGYCYKVRGKGLFVSKRKMIVDAQIFDGFTASIKRAGLVPKTKYISGNLNIPPEWVQDGLELSEGEEAIELVRLRLIDSEAAILETEWFPEKLFDGLIEEDLSQSLYTILEEKYGIFIASTSDLILPHIPSSLEREYLRLPPNSPVIVRNRVAFLKDGTPVEAVRSVYNPDKYEFRMNLVREGLAKI